MLSITLTKKEDKKWAQLEYKEDSVNNIVILVVKERFRHEGRGSPGFFNEHDEKNVRRWR